MATSSQQTYNYLVPASGTTHAVFQQCDFAVAGIATEDWQAFSTNHFQFRPQGVFIDNTQGTATATFSIQGVPFNAYMPAGYAGWVSFPSVANLVTEISGTGTVNLTYVDFPVINSTPVDSSGNPPSSNVTVQNPPTSPVNTQAIIGGSPIASNNPVPVTVENATLDVAVTPSIATLVAGTVTAAGSTTVGTPPANSRLRKLILGLTANATLAAAGNDVLTMQLNGVTIFTEAFTLGTTANAVNGMAYKRDIVFDMIAFSAGASGTLTATLGTALATGEFYVNAYFD